MRSRNACLGLVPAVLPAAASTKGKVCVMDRRRADNLSDHPTQLAARWRCEDILFLDFAARDDGVVLLVPMVDDGLASRQRRHTLGT